MTALGKTAIYDIIGDIHGYADELVELLEILGYREQHGCFRHEQRQAVFCGDFVDRGPQIAESIALVRTMVREDAAQAVMGNHEFNAIAFHTPRPGPQEDWYRPHTSQNIRQHQATLDQLDAGQRTEALEWFRGLPVALDLGAVRIVHACWDPDMISVLQQRLADGDRFSPSFLEDASTEGTLLHTAVERVLKGPEGQLPDGISVADKEGRSRRRIRIRWFDSPEGHSAGSYALPETGRLSNIPVPPDAVPCPYPADAPPVFVGHYWLDTRHQPLLRSNVACVDLSVARGGRLCAYRHHGERVLTSDSLVTVKARNAAAVS